MRINALLPAMLRSILGKMIFVNSNAHYITLMTGDKYSNTFSFEYNNPPPVANRSMEISSPRLHHGRAASYGSIIVPLAGQGAYGCRPYLCAHGSDHGQMDSRSRPEEIEGAVVRFSRCRWGCFHISKNKQKSHNLMSSDLFS